MADELEVIMNFDPERSLLSCLRDEDDESYKGFAYALEQGLQFTF